ncbi:MAG: RND family transporter [Deltaproteobacteria bacterium]|nr:RND family transporter [Deltaproteobacteria bacterium]MBN2670970.1 RND family transporter [Deltaproteobacteria bacterium]
MKQRKNSFANFVTSHPWPIIVIFVAVTVAAAFQLRHIELDTEMKNQLPVDLPTRKNLTQIEKLFGGTDMIMIVLSADDILDIDVIHRLKEMSKKFEHIKEFDRVITLFTAKHISAECGELVVEQAIRRIPKSEKQKETLRHDLKENELVYGNIVSKDFKHTVLIGFLATDASDEKVVGQLEQLIKQTKGPGDALIGGMPVTRVKLSKDIRKDMSRFLPVGLVLMFIFLLLCFREARGVLMPFIMTVMAIVFALGLLAFLGWKIHTVTVLLPVILLAVANDYGIHIMARYQEERAENKELDSKQLAHATVQHLNQPILASGITTMVGLLCLLSHIIIPAEQLGILAAAGVAFAMVGSLVFIPAVLAVLPKSKSKKKKEKKIQDVATLMSRLLNFIGDVASKKSRGILIISGVLLVAFATGAAFIVVDSNPMSFYKKNDPVWRATHMLNEHFGGWANVSIVAKGDIKDPAVMKEIDKLERHLKKHPLVGTTSSIAAMVRGMNRVMNDNAASADKVPDKRDLIAQYFLLYSLSGDIEDFNKLVDFNYRNAQILAQVRDSGTRAATDVVHYTQAYIDAHPQAPFTIVGGLLDVITNMVDYIVRGQLLSLFLSILLCGVLVGAVMRSVVAGLISMIPLGIAVSILFGLMGYWGIELNLITAMLSSIMIGVGIDYTIHFLWRYREERRLAEPMDAVKITLRSAGRGILFNGFSVVVGFVVLLLSQFFPVQFFGLLVVVSIVSCLIGALVVLPAVVIVFKPKFLEPTESGNSTEELPGAA